MEKEEIKEINDNLDLLKQSTDSLINKYRELQKVITIQNRKLEITNKLIANIYQTGYINVEYLIDLIKRWEIDVNDLEIFGRSIYLVDNYDIRNELDSTLVDSDLDFLIEEVFRIALNNSGINRDKHTIAYSKDVNNLKQYIEIDGNTFDSYKELMNYLYQWVEY